ncbi:hypothetical protein KPH14_009617 [Odynerus spinipes]|uniref:Platelet-derived growth factor (PDGF) family profile domain-containing protein n=1 Tax=Odynerus spinipes TaxID=1348599 RepID=A0AAD9RQ03_9HYME|nr:hypothetical protein KPH14_009617 [Odynerus spinipes]
MRYLRLLILIALSLSNAAPSMTTDDKVHHRLPRRIPYSRTTTIETWRKFPCREPQPRAYILPDLMQSFYQNLGKSVNFPIYIVLKRCDMHSGCCTTSNKSCTPVDSEIYYEDIEIEIYSLKTNNTRKEWIRVEQHGKCACAVTTAEERHHSKKRKPNIVIL